VAEKGEGKWKKKKGPRKGGGGCPPFIKFFAAGCSDEKRKNRRRRGGEDQKGDVDLDSLAKVLLPFLAARGPEKKKGQEGEKERFCCCLAVSLPKKR